MRLWRWPRQDEVVLGCVDAATEARMKEEVEEAARTGDTVGGVFEVVVHGAPAGARHLRQLGRAAGWAAGRRGDEHSGGKGGGDWPGRGGGRVVRFGGPRSDLLCASGYGPAHAIYASAKQCGRHRGRGFEWRGYRGARVPEAHFDSAAPLESVRFDTREGNSASYERINICVVPAAGVVAEAMVALTVAAQAQQKFGGDSALEMKRNFLGYIEQMRAY